MAEFTTYIEGKKDRCPIEIAYGNEVVDILFSDESLQNDMYGEFLKSSLRGESSDVAKGIVTAIQIFARHIPGISMTWIKSNGGD